MKKNKGFISLLKSKFRVSIALIFFIFISSNFISCNLIPKEEEVQAPTLIEPPKVTYNTISAKRGTIVKSLDGDAEILPNKMQNLYFEYRGGRLSKINVKLWDAVKKGDVLAELDTDSLNRQIKEQEIIFKKAQLTYEHYIATKGEQYQIESAALDVELEKIKLEDLKQELSKSKLVSPFSGRITYVTDAKLGDNINAFDPVFTIADPSNLVLKYSGRYNSEFQLGMNVKILYNKTSYYGKVAAVPSSIPTSDSEKKDEEYVYISFDKVPENAKFGENASISVEIAKKENTIVLPINAIHKDGDLTYVFLYENDAKVERYVETGIESSMEVEILKGLNDGEKIIVD